jgi:dihydroorotate dehydrogenase (fumarate)
LLHDGVNHASVLLDGMQAWMLEHEYLSVQQMKGSMSQGAVAEPAAFERANYMKELNSFNLHFR